MLHFEANLAINDAPLGRAVLIAPDAALVVATPPVGSLEYTSPQGVLNIKETPIAAFAHVESPKGGLTLVSAPVATIVEVFFLPVLAINDGNEFLWLDDGGRLLIE